MADEVRITILSENTAAEEYLSAEYGLSVWIEVDDTCILFDTGMAGAFAANADKLGIDLSKAVHLVLSHGHSDHTGGIALVFDRSPEVIIHLHPDAAMPKYLAETADRAKSIGMPGPSLHVVKDMTGRCLFLTDVTRLTEHVFLTGPVPRKTAYEKIVEPFTLDPEGRVPDTMEDDQALWIETGKGLIIVLGCAHAGVVNTIDYIREKSGCTEIRAVIGGMHLMSADRQTIELTAEALAAFKPRLIAPNHCTGEAACSYFKQLFADIYKPSGAGTVFTFQE